MPDLSERRADADGPLVADEAARLKILKALDLLDTQPEDAFDTVVALARALFRAPMAALSLVDADRQWFKAKAGFDLSETPRELGFCHHAIMRDQVLWVADAALDDRFAQASQSEAPVTVRFYAGAPIVVRGQPIGALCVMSDRPRRRSRVLADQLSMLANMASRGCELRLALLEVEDARRQALAASQAKSQFLANMSHELRTPLNGVIGVASVLERTDLDASQREMIRIIRGSGETLTALLNDVLDISKVEAGRFDLQLEAFRLDDVVQQSVELYQLRAEDKGLALRARYGGGETYLGDGARIRQIVTNLVSNAVKFTDAGIIDIQIHTEAQANGDRVQIDVRDTGPGFSEAVNARLFERFEQGDGTLTRRHGGTGLGLSISRALALLMGGDLVATSARGQGACFSLILDLQRVEPAAESGEADNDAPPPSDFQGIRVLAADDNETNRKVIGLILASVGVDVTLVVDGLQAVETFVDGDFDMVFMDVQMPVMDGLEAIRRMRAHERIHSLPRTPINTLSAHAMSEHVEMSGAAGADEHLSKPISAERLLQALMAGVEPDADTGSRSDDQASCG